MTARAPSSKKATKKRAKKTAKKIPAPRGRFASRAVRRERAVLVVDGLRAEYSDAVCALHHRNAFELLVATILSAQCTDARVNIVTPSLFKAYPTPKKMAAAPIERIEILIQSTGFFRNKAKSIKGASSAITHEFGGKVPRTMDELLTLPGVARKTANVVLGVAHGIAVGVVVDTHVGRISTLLGLTKETDPKKIERDLMELLPEDEWIAYSHRMIAHGRSVCIARRPQCNECRFAPICPSAVL